MHTLRSVARTVQKKNYIGGRRAQSQIARLKRFFLLIAGKCLTLLKLKIHAQLMH